MSFKDFGWVDRVEKKRQGSRVPIQSRMREESPIQVSLWLRSLSSISLMPL